MRSKIENTMMILLRLLTIPVLLLLVGCGSDDTVPPDIETPLSQILVYPVTPNQTDPAISPGLNTQFAFIARDSTVRKNKLFVFLPGTLAEPTTYLYINQTAAEHGYHSFGIDYQNNRRISSFCGDTNDGDCDYRVLTEFYDGTDASPDVAVGAAYSFVNRITKMIQYLDNLNPSQNWGQFLDADDNIKWELVSLAGHSQGSAHTLYISKRVNLFRASFFSGPNGFELSDGSLPAWMAQPGATSMADVYGFSNTNDDLYAWDYAQRVWNEIGLLGTEVNVDQAAGLSSSHRFFTEVTPPTTQGSASPAHGSTAVDLVTPTGENGRPAFERVWEYMCFPE